MKEYSKKQVAIWEKSYITVYRDGYIDAHGEMGEYTLLDIFYNGYTLAGNSPEGNLCIYTAAGVELEIHSKSLARVLRKRALQQNNIAELQA